MVNVENGGIVFYKINIFIMKIRNIKIYNRKLIKELNIKIMLWLLIEILNIIKM